MHNSYPFMVMGCLYGASPRENLRYIEKKTCLPLQLPRRQTKERANKIFANMKHSVPNLDKQAARHNLWILEEMRRLVNKRVSARR